MITEIRGFGLHVRRLRKEQGLTQESLAERADLSSDTIRKIERGQMSPTLKTLRRLCHGLGISLSALFHRWELGEQEQIG